MIRSVKQAGATWLGMIVVSCVLAGSAAAQIPSGYYDSVDETNAATLRATVHAVIDDHQRFPYTSGSTDTWNILEAAQQDPAASGRFLDIYRNQSLVKVSAGNSLYNREHTWPKSYGFPDDSSSNYPYTDCHMLRLCDDGYNSARSNKPYRNCSSGCTEYTTVANNGKGGGSGTYPGNSNWSSGSFTAGIWEVWNGRRGDIARAMFYADLRYEGGVHGVTGFSEPDLILTDNRTLMANSNTGNNEPVGYMGSLTVLLQWHLDDPVDALEQQHNDVVYNFQGNRNPFVDHPEWVDCLFNATCAASGPAVPGGVFTTGGDGQVDISWNPNSEMNLAGYNVYRGTVSSGPYSQLNGALVPTAAYTDLTVTNGTTYYYVVTAEDTTPIESGFSAEVSATPTAIISPEGGPWINEFHYDNTSGDIGEFVEIAGPAGTDLSSWTVVGYNGNGGAMYKTINLAGVLPDLGNCIGALSFDFDGMQNGAPDGLALVDDLGVVRQFLSYEGVLVAADGPAFGATSINVGVSESSFTPAGQSLQLGGSGSVYDDFTWQPAQGETLDAVNAGQSFTGGCSATYCTAGTSASGCQATLSATGVPSATAASGFDLFATGVEGNKDGLYFFGTNGQQSNAWGNGTSFQCVVPPVKRAGLLSGTGSNGVCDGSFSQDFNALWTAQPAKNPGAGAVVQAQLWYRDPVNTSNQTTSLSDAIEFTVQP